MSPPRMAVAPALQPAVQLAAKAGANRSCETPRAHRALRTAEVVVVVVVVVAAAVAAAAATGHGDTTMSTLPPPHSLWCGLGLWDKPTVRSAPTALALLAAGTSLWQMVAA